MASSGHLVIFDCDGVLVDSEPVSVRVLVNALRRKGVDMDEAEAYRRFLGRSLATVTKTMSEEFGIEADVRVMSAHRTPAVVAAFAAGARENGYAAIICGAGVAHHLDRASNRIAEPTIRRTCAPAVGRAADPEGADRADPRFRVVSGGRAA